MRWKPTIIKAVIRDPCGCLGIVANHDPGYGVPDMVPGTCVVVDEPSYIFARVFCMDKITFLTSPVASNVFRPPAWRGAGVIVVVVVVDEDSHCPLLPQGLSLDLAAGVNVAVFDLDLFTRQADNPLYHKFLPPARPTKGDDFPTLRPLQQKGRAVDQDPIAGEHSTWRRRSEFSRTIRADRAPCTRPVLAILDIAGKREPALGTCGIDVAA